MLLICEKRSAKNWGFMAGVVELSTAPTVDTHEILKLGSLTIHIIPYWQWTLCQ